MANDRNGRSILIGRVLTLRIAPLCRLIRICPDSVSITEPKKELLDNFNEGTSESKSNLLPPPPSLPTRIDPDWLSAYNSHGVSETYQTWILTAYVLHEHGEDGLIDETLLDSVDERRSDTIDGEALEGQTEDAIDGLLEDPWFAIDQLLLHRRNVEHRRCTMRPLTPAKNGARSVACPNTVFGTTSWFVSGEPKRTTSFPRNPDAEPVPYWNKRA